MARGCPYLHSLEECPCRCHHHGTHKPSIRGRDPCMARMLTASAVCLLLGRVPDGPFLAGKCKYPVTLPEPFQSPCRYPCTSPELGPVVLPIGCGEMGQAALDWIFRPAVLQLFGTEVDFVPRVAVLCTRFCLKTALPSAFCCFKSSASALDAWEAATCCKSRLKTGIEAPAFIEAFWGKFCCWLGKVQSGF